MKHVIQIILTFFLLSIHVHANDVLRLVTTTSTDNSGLTDYLIEQFKTETGINVHTVAVGTGKALAIAKNGDADAILVHSKTDELKFVEQGYGVQRFDVMYNDFIIVGPSALSEISSVQDVLSQIKTTGSLFLSRGDDSGTHKKEKALWFKAGITPQGSWYRESGQGMGKTLQIASELDAYALTDRGTWLAQNANQSSNLKIVYEGDEQLFNPYGIIAVNPEKFSHVNIGGAQAFINWLLSEHGQKLIAEFKINGQQLFFPIAG